MSNSVRFQAAGDQIAYLGAGLPDPEFGFTLTMWIRVAASTGTFATFGRLSASGTTTATFATTSTGAGGPTYATAGGVLTAAAGMTAGTWYRYATTRLGSTGNLYTAQDLGGATQLVSGTVSGANNPDQICFGGRSAGDGSEALNGRVAYAKLWGSVLTQAEIEAEWLSTVPVIGANLAGDWRLQGASDLTDHSGNGRHLTAGATPATTEDGPPISAPSNNSRFLVFF